MSQCEMCGKDTDLFVAIIEGTKLNVCKGCVRFGKLVSVAPKPVKKKEEVKEAKPEKEVIELTVSDFSKRIKEARERLGLSQEELGKKIAERESIIQKLETGHMSPSMELARKLERFLKITLIEVYEEKFGGSTESKTDVLTLGDMIKIKKR